MLTLSALSIRVSLLWNIPHIRIEIKASVPLTAMLRTNGFHFSQMKWHFRFFYYRCSDDGAIPQSPCVIWQCCTECTGAYRCGSPQRPMKYACYHSAGLSDSKNDTAASFWKINDISDWLRMNGVPGSVFSSHAVWAQFWELSLLRGRSEYYFSAEMLSGLWVWAVYYYWSN